MSDCKYEYRSYPDGMETNLCLGTIGLKAKHSIVVIAVLGILCTAMIRNLFGFLLGLFLVALAVAVWYLQKDQKVLDVYADALYLFEEGNEASAMRLPVSEIKEWCVNKESSYTILLTTMDNQQFMGKSFQVSRATKLLNSVMPDKSLEHIRMEQIKKMRKDKKK